MRITALCLVVCILLCCAGCAQPLPPENSDISQNLNKVELSLISPPSDNSEVQQKLNALELALTSAPVVLGSVPEEVYAERMAHTIGMPLVMEMTERESNPIALFLAAVNQGIYEKENLRDGFSAEVLCAAEDSTAKVFQDIPHTERMDYNEHTDYIELFCQALRMSAFVKDGVSLESALLNRIENGPAPVLAYSEADQCWYSYFILYNSEYAYILTVYYRDSGLELQSMLLTYKTSGYAGCGTSRMYARNAWTAQTAALICSLENLLAGESLLESRRQEPDEYDEFAVYELPGAYTLGEWKADITTHSYFCETATGESYIECAELVNYRISR